MVLNISMDKLEVPFFDSKITPRTKKYSVYVMNPKTNRPNLIHFGARGYEQFFDKIGKWSSLNHNDTERRKRYRARHKWIKKNGKTAYLNKLSPEYWSWNYLW